MMRELIRKILLEIVKKGKVICDDCGWSWNISEGGKDTYICHECGHDNTPIKKN
jgi:DNA-directed RNA polymerase subunit RPC12/RpoP